MRERLRPGHLPLFDSGAPGLVPVQSHPRHAEIRLKFTPDRQDADAAQRGGIEFRTDAIARERAERRRAQAAPSKVNACALLYLQTAAGATGRQVLGLVGGAVAAGWVLFQVGFLKAYQLSRFTCFFDPGTDPQGDCYNQVQSITAIGSGRFSGKGLFNGIQVFSMDIFNKGEFE